MLSLQDRRDKLLGFVELHGFIELHGFVEFFELLFVTHNVHFESVDFSDGGEFLIFFNSLSNVKSSNLLRVALAQRIQSTMLNWVFPNNVMAYTISFLSGLTIPLYKNNPYNFSEMICLSTL